MITGIYTVIGGANAVMRTDDAGLVYCRCKCFIIFWIG
jgi:hypothetical protein